MGPGEGVALSATVVARVTASASSIHKHVPLPLTRSLGRVAPSGRPHCRIIACAMTTGYSG